MDENILIVSDNSWVKKNKKRGVVLFVLSIVLLAVGGILSFVAEMSWKELNNMHAAYNDPARDLVGGISSISIGMFILSGVFAGTAIILLVLYFYMKKMELTVTDKRIYGKVAFGKQVDLPVDSISAVSTSALKGIAVATSSGKIAFLGLTNRDEISKAISNLIINRQSAKAPVSQATAAAPTANSMDDLLKLNDLLKAGIITQEEFEIKKKQLLGL